MCECIRGVELGTPGEPTQSNRGSWGTWVVLRGAQSRASFVCFIQMQYGA